MPWTLYRYILREIIKVLILATAVLVVIISLAVAIKPLSDGDLSPTAMIKLVLFTMPTVLQFALPFAGAFAGTLVFSRMAADNEILACSASGLSYKLILLPVFVLGMSMTLLLYYMSNYVVPDFNQAASRLVVGDLIQLVVTQVQRGRPIQLGEGGRWVLYADSAEVVAEGLMLPENLTKVQPEKMIVLQKAVLSQRDAKGNVEREGTATQAQILLFRVKNQTKATVSLRDVTVYEAEKGDMFHAAEWRVPEQDVPSNIRNDPQFMSLPELRDLYHDPEGYDRVRDGQRQLAQAIAAQIMLDEVQRALAPKPGNKSPSVALHGLADEEYVLRAPVVERGDGKLKLSADGPRRIEIDYLVANSRRRTFTASAATLTAKADDAQSEPYLALELNDARVSNVGFSGGAEHQRLSLPRLSAADQPLQRIANESSASLLAAAARPPLAGSTAVTSRARSLQNNVDKLLHKIIGQLHTRAATAVACMLILLFAAVLSIRMRTYPVLVVYLIVWLTCFLAIAVIQGGQTMVGRPSHAVGSGLAILWLGNVALAGVLFWNYSRLGRE